MTEKLFYLLAILAVALAVGVGIGSVAFAQPAEPTPTWVTIDAGAELDAGAAAVVVEEPAKAIPDPVDNPTGFAGEVRDAYKGGLWSYLIVLVLFGLARFGVWLGKTYPRKFSWLQGKILAALVAACSVLSATAVEVAVGGGWRVIASALLAAVVLYLRPEPKES